MAETTVVKKNQKVKVEYLNADGEATKDLTEAHGVKISVNGYDPVNVAFAELPEHIQRGGMAFGLQTRFRNEVNTAATIEDGYNGLMDTLSGFAEGSWRSAGVGGGGTPDIIEALIRATTEAGIHTEEKESAWRDMYAELDAKQKAKQTEQWLLKGPVRKHYDLIKEEKAKAALERAKANRKAAGKEQLEESLNDL